MLYIKVKGTSYINVGSNDYISKYYNLSINIDV